MKALWVLLLGAIFAGCHLLYYGSNNDPIFLENGALRISDFAYYVVIIRSFWFGSHQGVYNLQDNLAVLRELLGVDVGGVMPLAVTPIAAFLFLPFAMISDYSMGVAKSLWCGLSFSVLFAGLWGLRDLWQKFSLAGRLRLLLLAATVLFSHSCFLALWLGQTSIFFVASLLSLFHFLRKRQSAVVQILPALFFIGLKPTYFGIAALLLIAFRAWKALLISAGFLVLSGIFFSAYTSWTWLTEYISMFLVFSQYPLPPEFRLPFAFDQMNVFRSVWSLFLSQENLLLFSRLVLFLGIVGGLLSFFRFQGENQGVVRMVFLTGLYLLFSPYLSPYEELISAFPLLLVIRKRPDIVSGFEYFLVLPLLLTVLNFNPIMPVIGREILWLFKTFLFGFYTLCLLRESPESV